MSTESANTSTLNAVVDALPRVSIDSKWYRIIPSRFPPISIYERIAANDRWDAIVEVEVLTNPRLASRERLISNAAQAPVNDDRLQNWNHAPFTYANPEGSFFFREVLPCLELSDSLQTALSISVKRRELFLSRTDERPLGLDMRVLTTPVKGRFIDMTSLPQTLTKEERWAIGDVIAKRDDIDGILFPSLNRKKAMCLAALHGHVLGKALQAQHFRYSWDGKRISSLYDFETEKKILPELLDSSDDVLAA